MSDDTEKAEPVAWRDNRTTAEEFCKGAFGPFGVDLEPYIKIVTELLDHAAPPRCDAQSVRDIWHIEPSVPADGFECYFLTREGKQVAEICGPQTDERARHLDDLVFAANGNAPDIASAWSQVEKWLAAYAEEEQLFSRFADNVMLGGIMSAKQRRAISAALSETKPAQGDSGMTAEKAEAADDFNGIGWREYMRGIENGNIDPTGVRLRAVCKIARENLEALASNVRSVREATIEECAKICVLHAQWADDKTREDESPNSTHNQLFATIGNTANDCAELIRALSETKPSQWDADSEVITDEQLAISGMNKDWNRLYNAICDIISIAKDAQATDALGDIIKRAEEALVP